jgi:hypothetical protein
MVQRTENNEYCFVRKPHGIPSTFGSQFSILDELVREEPSFFASQMQQFTAAEEY